MEPKRITGIGVLLGLFLSGLAALALAAEDVPRMSKEDLKSLIGKSDVVILDVRTDGDWQNSDKKIQGAVREDPALFDGWASKYPREKTLVLYCA